MLFETYDLGIDPRVAHVLAGLLLGAVFGVAAQVSRFCLRRAVAGPRDERASAGAVWLVALATAILGFAVAAATGFVDLQGHRIMSADLPVVAVVLGGLAFGIGMVLTRGCVSRLTVLSATGNLRAAVVLIVFAITAHALMKGTLAPVLTFLNDLTVASPVSSLAALPFAMPLLLLAAVIAAALLIRRARPAPLHLVMGALIGLVAVAGWVTTSVLLMDEFDPLPVQSAAFTLPWSDTLFWVIASSAIPAGFGTGFIAGVLAGSFASAALRGELALQSFESPQQTLRYAAGAVLMGMGGVLAGGCTIGAGLSGTASGSLSALIALGAIATGGWASAQVMGVRARGVPATA